MKRSILRAVLLGSTLAATGALAQPATSTDENTLSEVMVTARRTEERLLTVPVAVTAFGGDQLEQKQLRDTNDLQFRVPGLRVQYDAGRSNNFQIRGVSRTLGSEPGVVTYVAEVPQEIYGSPPLYDMASVQVLKGPQGTLFGKNSVGGAVLLEPKRPTDVVEGFVSALGGSYGLWEGTGAINVPINDVLKVRAAARYTRRGALLENISGHDLDTWNRLSGRLSILFEPTDNISNYLVADGYRSRDWTAPPGGLVQAIAACPTSAVACLYTPPTSTALGVKSLPALFAEQQRLGIRAINADPTLIGVNPINLWGVANHTTVDFGGVTVKNIFGYRKLKQHLLRDLDGIGVGLLGSERPEDHDQITEELQIKGMAFDDKLSWVTGAYYSENNDNIRNQLSTTFIDTPPLPSLPPHKRILTALATTKTHAFFGQMTYDLGAVVEGLKVTGGFRYTWDKRKLLSSDHYTAVTPANCNNTIKTGPQAGQFLPGTDPATCFRTLRYESKAPSWNVNLEYQVNYNLFVYGTVRKGFKGGGFNQFATGTTFVTYKPEKLRDMEVGLKSQGKLGEAPYRFTAALFSGKYKDIQTNQAAFIDNALQSLVLNAGAAKVKGGEVELTLQPVRGLELNGYYGLTDGKYEDFFLLVAGTPLALTGKRLVGVPRTTAGASIAYTAQLGDDVGSLTFAANANYRGRIIFDHTVGDEFGGSPKLTVADASVTWNEVLGRPLTAMVYVRNLTNKAAVLQAGDIRAQLAVATRLYGAPRTWGAELTYRF